MASKMHQMKKNDQPFKGDWHLVQFLYIELQDNHTQKFKAMLSRRALYRAPLAGRLFLLSSVRGYAKESLLGSVQHFDPQAPAPVLETNKVTETNRLEKTLGKFWEKVDLKETSEGFHVQLDNKTIKTPLGFDLVIPTNRPTLAHLLKHEWQHLPNLKIRPYLVPLTSVVSRAIDLTRVKDLNDPEMATKIGDLEALKRQLLRYLDTDTLLVFSPAEDCDGKLRRAQEEMYRPLIAEMEKFFSSYSHPSKRNDKLVLTYLDSDLHGLVGNMQPAETREAVSNWMDSLDVWDLVVLEKATLTAKSFLSGVAILRMNDLNDDFKMSLEDVSRAATLEIIYQTERWGEVEDTHDVDKVDVRRNLGTASLIAYKA
ncbi:hypothetical protein CANARDRAFT_29243 [[Candida] arabinofermentans NRRL YB-2248]|uniref:Uncharacterized protein n=1 Tax=[Candida] arabinofermentans NRRL YB-2248 TaxID=983967 RepID=A0A1E4SY17_9ASCO|nr:hypothetical protein CANARDRAFT_29243 [[Candida] arabinofermentans NRRL YB-2248]